MKVLDILKEGADGSIQVITEFSAQELQNLLQLAINVSASVGLTVERDARAQITVDEDHELND